MVRNMVLTGHIRNVDHTVSYTIIQCAKCRLRAQMATYNRDDSIAWLHGTVRIPNVYVEQHD